MDEQLIRPWHKHLFFGIGAAVIIFDQITKWLVLKNIPLNSSYIPFSSLYPYFRFTHVANKGMAFGQFQELSLFFTILPFIVASGIIYYNYRSPIQTRLFRLSMGLLFGGAIGNLIDRLRVGYVIDFVHINLRPLLDSEKYTWAVFDILNWAVFNIADLSIVVGVSILAFIMITTPEPESEAEAEEESSSASQMAQTKPEV